MSIFNPNETKQAHDARQQAAINSPTSPDADRSAYVGTHVADQIQIPTMAAPPAPAMAAPTMQAQAPMNPRPVGATVEDDVRPVGF